MNCRYHDEMHLTNCGSPKKTSLLWGDGSGRSCDAERLPCWPFDILFNACGRRGRWFKEAPVQKRNRITWKT